MKKLLLIAVIFALILLYPYISFGTNNEQVFYGGNVYSLEQGVLTLGTTHYFDSQEISTMMGIDLRIDQENQMVLVKDHYHQTSKEYKILTYQEAQSSTPAFPNTLPLVYRDGVFLPFGFIESLSSTVIHYNENSHSLYILPQSKASSYELQSFTNLSYNYTITNNQIGYQLKKSGNVLEEDILFIQDKNGLFSAVITCDRLDEVNLAAVREYLNDYQSSDEDIFQQFVHLKETYFSAIKSDYEKEFLFGSQEDPSTGSNMKVFANAIEDIYGQESQIIIYNTVTSSKTRTTEETNIDITVPVVSTKTLYSIYFTMNHENVNAQSLGRISDFIRSLSIHQLPAQKTPLKALENKSIVSSVTRGVYPDLRKFKPNYVWLRSASAGYKISYPSTFIPYHQNHIIDPLGYQSFKANAHTDISISVEWGGQPSVIKDKIRFIQQLNGNQMKEYKEGSFKLSDREFQYIDYELTANEERVYVKEYFTVENAKLYTLKLSSKFFRPSLKIQHEFIRMASSLTFFTPASSSNVLGESTTDQYTEYINKEEGYSFLYPGSFSLDMLPSKDIYYDAFKVVSPDYAGPFDILVSEGELHSEPTREVAAKFIQGDKDTIKKYSAPYLDRIYTPLTSSFYVKDGVFYVLRLVNYLDQNDRNTLCYSIDILRNKKTYSLFICVNEYLTKDGKLYNTKLAAMMNTISQSFQLENTKEYIERINAGETRNRKVVFIEKYFQSLLDPSLKVSSAAYIDSSDNLLVSVDGDYENYFFVIHTDFAKDVKILSKIPKEELMVASISELMLRYGNKEIEQIIPDHKGMALTIRYRNTKSHPIIEKKYLVTVEYASNAFITKLSRVNHATLLKEECKSFIKNSLSITEANITFLSEDEFANIDHHQGKYYTFAYIEYGQSYAYIALEINPLNDDMKIVSFMSLAEALSLANTVLQQEYKTDSFIKIFHHTNDKNKFELKFLWVLDNTVKYDLVKIRFNPEKNKIEFES